MKRIAGIILTLILMSIAFAGVAMAAEESLTISGDGVSKSVSYTKSELAAMTGQIVKAEYSSTNNFPTTKSFTAEGISLEYLLNEAGLKADATLITFTASDGYKMSFTVQELLKDKRYTYDANTPAEVQTIIAYKSGEDDFLKLVMGQRAVGEQTTPWFVKYVSQIEVTTAALDKWGKVTSVRETSGDTVSVTLNHANIDNVKIYYTTDGSMPTYNSELYNKSATYYQPELNVPIVVSKDTTIKAIAIGPGRQASDVTTVTVSFGQSAFVDLTGYSWAEDSINALASANIINGIGNNRFDPAGGLKRSEFAKMMVLALGGEPATSGSTFSDVASSAWYYGYVEAAAKLGLIHGYEDGTFRPNDTLSKEEMITVVVNTLADADEIAALSEDVLRPFTQESRISNWAKGNVAYAEQQGLLEHGHFVIASGNFLYLNGQADANRAEAAEIVNRLLSVK